MKHIHPFPARMAPEIALERISRLNPSQLVLDPMCGSGMVLSVAARKGIPAIGVDVDPLARMMSRVSTTAISEDEVRGALARLLRGAQSTLVPQSLPWIDDDRPTAQFVAYWFGQKQQNQLRCLSHGLMVEPIARSRKVVNLLKVAMSRLIVSKEPKASLARDTAHSRPHRTIMDNDYDVFHGMQQSVAYVLSALDASSIERNAKVYDGDARQLRQVRTNSVDMVITSPPYLNAIDYMRGHRLALVWLGYRIGVLSTIRSSAIGAERSGMESGGDLWKSVVDRHQLTEMSPRNAKILHRYFLDLSQQVRQTVRVMKPGARACYVIGNSDIRGTLVPNNELLKTAARLAGLIVISETVRDIPERRRYLPLPRNEGALSKRMRTEHIVEFERAL